MAATPPARIPLPGRRRRRRRATALGAALPAALPAALLLLPIAAGAAAARPGTVRAAPAGAFGSLAGEVTGPQGLPVAGAAVTLALESGEVRETESDAAGAFRFDAVPEGAHRLTVSRPGFAEATEEFTVAGEGEVRLAVALDLAFAERIVVTGQRVERGLGETTVSVAVADRERLATGTEADLHQLVAMTPNVSSSSDVRGFLIRGVSQSGFGSGSGLLLSAQVDGAAVQGYQGSFFGPFSTWDLDRVEIFRGPQSTQQGRNALAGAIVLRTADPEYRTGFRGRVRLGNAAARQVSGVANVPLVEGRAALRVAFDRREGDGFVSAPTRGEDDYDGRTAETLRAKLRFDPTPRLRGLLTVARTDSRGGDSRILAARFPAERVNLSDHPADDGSRHRFGVLELGYRWTDTLTLESVSTLYAHDYRREEDLDGSPAPAGVLDYTTDDRWATQQFLLRYEGAGRRRGVLGFHYANLDDRLRADAAGPGELAGLPPGFTLTSFFSTDERTRNAALFGEADLELSDAWTVTLGARYDDERRETENIQGVVSDPPLPAFPPAPSSGEVVEASYRAFLPKAALTRAFTPAFSASASWQRGYRAGGRSVAVLSQQVSDFDPEFTDNYELALRAGAPDRRWFLHANFFLSDWSAQQVRVLTDLGLAVDTLTVNAGESTLTGAEAQAGYWLRPGLQVYSSVGLLRTRFDEFRDADRDFTGNEFPHAPRWSLLAGLSARFAESWSGRAEVGAQGESFSAADNDPRFRVPRRALVNARFGYRRGGWGVFAYGRNLLDEDYLVEAWAPSDPRLGAFGRAGAPREVGVELDFRY